MRRLRALLPALLLFALLVPASRADAAYSVICSGYSSCQSKGYSNAGYSAKQGMSYWAMYTGTNCTNYVAYRLVATNGMPNKRPKPGVGNARDWGTTMSSVTNATPALGSVAWWGRQSGRNHVAYVEKIVSSSEIWVSESNWAGSFDWRKITRSGSGWPDGFIHFADPNEPLTMAAVIKPALTDNPTAGTGLSVTDGTWDPEGGDLTYRFQWLLDGEDIPDATDRQFVPPEETVGRVLSARVVITRPGYRATYLRTNGAAVMPSRIVATELPTITGDPREGRTLTATAGTWSPSDSEILSYRWLEENTAIAGATGTTFTPGPAQIGKRIRLQVMARHPAYGARSARSTWTATIAPDDLTLVVPPTVSGSLRVGETLTFGAGTWTPSSPTASYRWMVGSKGVANGPTFVLRPEDLGRTIRVQEAVRHPGYITRFGRSAPTSAVAKGIIGRGSRPKVTGVPKVGRTLTATDGTWRPKDRTLTYRWYVANKRVAGATSKTFTVRRSDAGHTVSVYVTAHRAGYEDRLSLPADRRYIVR